LAVGRNEIVLKASDSTGAQMEKRVVITVNGAPSDVVITSPINGSNVPYGVPVELVATAKDPNGDATTFTWTLDGKPTEGELLHLTPGRHTVIGTATDPRGLMGVSEPVEFFVDFPAMGTISISIPKDDSVVTYGDAVKPEYISKVPDGVRIVTESLKWEVDDKTVSTPITGLSFGYHTLTLTAKDNFDREDYSSSVRFRVVPKLDNMVTIESPENGAVAITGAVDFKGSAIDFDNNPITDNNRYLWTSNIQGELGRGMSGSVVLEPGIHQVTLSIEGFDGVKKTVTVPYSPLPQDDYVLMINAIHGSPEESPTVVRHNTTGPRIPLETGMYLFRGDVLYIPADVKIDVISISTGDNANPNSLRGPEYTVK
jgi:hypothetical protein